MIGKSIAQYTVQEKIGEGGMGAVYRAVDSKLGRDVALKLLPQGLSNDGERRARFQREARTLASLSHANIASIFDYEVADGQAFLVMELIHGDDLSERISEGPIPVDEAIAIATEIASGLEAAHEKGIVHRDLKPANIKLTPDRKVKILDFGLARAYSTEDDSEFDMALSPTITSAHTQDGTILGTAAYMSPEQARGRPLDKRSDIWAFGVVLFEMLSGQQLIEGDTVSDKLAAILKSDPPWEQLPANTPPRVRELLERCLAKRRHDRLQDIGDARIELEWTADGRTGTPAHVETAAPAIPRLRLAIAAVALAAVAAAVSWNLHPTSRSATEGAKDAAHHLSFSYPPELRVESVMPAPNGVLGILARRRERQSSGDDALRLYTREQGNPKPRLVPGSAGIVAYCFSHDSKWIAMIAPDGSQSPSLHLWKVPVDQSSPPLRVANWAQEWTPNLHWLRDGELIISTFDRKFVRIPTDGRAPGLAVPTQNRDFDDAFTPLPSNNTELPDGIHLFDTVEVWSDNGYARHIAIANVNTGEAHLVLENAHNPRWLDSGHLLFSRGNSILAVQFDMDALETIGGPIAVADGLRTTEAWDHGLFDLTANGTLIYASGGLVGESRQLAWTNPAFNEFKPWSDDRRAYVEQLITAPDNRHLAVTIAANTGLYEVWLSELERPGLRRFAFETGRDCQPALFTPDGSQLLYRSTTPATIRFTTLAVDGRSSPRLLFEASRLTDFYAATSFADDGKQILFTYTSDGVDEIRIYSILDDAERGPPSRTLLANASDGNLSPDGKWLSYTSSNSGRNEVYLRRWLGGGELGPDLRVSTDGGRLPFWFRASETSPIEIVYSDQRKLYAVAFNGGTSLGRPQLLAEFGPKVRTFSPLSNSRILAQLASEDETEPEHLSVVLNWGNSIQTLLESAR